MTISISSSADRRLPAALSLIALLLAGCGQAETPPAATPDRTAVVDTAEAGAKPVAAAPPAAGADGLAALYAEDLTQAVAGAKKVAFRGEGGFGGMTCSPGTIAGTSAASRALTLTLPADAAARANVLAVVTPERGLLEVYSPYDGEAEAEDLVIPSETISWAKARNQPVFATSADALDALRPGKATPEALFVEAGRYRFALVNGIDAGLLSANGAKVKVVAACSFDWTP